jgi:hypothetical protein
MSCNFDVKEMICFADLQSGGAQSDFKASSYLRHIPGHQCPAMPLHADVYPVHPARRNAKEPKLNNRSELSDALSAYRQLD